MKKKLLSVILGMTMVASLLAGCGSGDSTDSSTGTSGADDAVVSSTQSTGTASYESTVPESDYVFTSTITIICPVKAGGDTDRNTRLLAEAMQEVLGVNVVVKNVEGGATVMGMQECLDSDPDGTTLIINGTDIFVPYMQGTSDITIDSFKTVAIPIIDNTTVLAVNQSSGWNTLEDLLAASQAAPNTIEYGGKIGAANQICGIAMETEWNAGLKFVDVGNNSAKMTALLGEQTDVINISYALAADYFATGDFIPLCLLGSEKNELLPDIPLASEYGLTDIDFSKFFWVGTHPDTPDEIVNALAAAIEQVCNDPDFIASMESYYLTVDFMAGEEAQEFANAMYTDTLLPYQDEFLAQQ